ncbi:MAG: hypothetical protein JXR64_07600, partial [Spirochaetales bacterium]|nr:hypothetical protein [Spirochaetales bacterium]
MNKKILLLLLSIFIGNSLFSQSTYSGNLSVASNTFFNKYSDTEDYLLGGCNAFPLGTFVNIKLPYSDDSVNVKIVSRIPEDGIFILIDPLAGQKLDLTTGDVLPVRIEVINFTPPPLSETEIESVEPEPEIKGLTAENLIETPV